jgi:hypothetical protein
MAQENADCDRSLFDTFISAPARAGVPREAINQALQITQRNIANVIEHAVRLFGRLTGARCAVCVKLVYYDPNDSRNLYVETHTRDRDTVRTKGAITTIRDTQLDTMQQIGPFLQNRPANIAIESTLKMTFQMRLQNTDIATSGPSGGKTIRLQSCAASRTYG